MTHFFPLIERGALALLLVAAWPAGAHAGDPAGAAPAPAAVAGFGVAVAPELLERARGGADTNAAEATLNGVVTGNSATQVLTGSNTIAASSFAGATGIPIVIQNSGANVLIQNATVINLQFK